MYIGQFGYKPMHFSTNTQPNFCITTLYIQGVSKTKAILDELI